MQDQDANDLLDLDALIQHARLTAEHHRSTDTAAAGVVRLLAEADGFLPVSVLLNDGVPREVLADLVRAPKDKRAKPKAKLGVVCGDPWVWLTSTGWQASGRASGRERTVDAMTATHAMAPTQISEWFGQRRARLDSKGVEARVVSGAGIRRFSSVVTARAWSTLKAQADGEGSVGLLTGGWLPDALCVTRWPLTDGGRSLYEQCWDAKPSDDDLAESTAAIEVEDTRKSDDPLRSKVAAAAEAVDSLRVAQAVVWVVRSRSVADRLRDLGVDDRTRQPRQYLVPACALGLGGADIGVVNRPWWPTLVSPDDQAA